RRGVHGELRERRASHGVQVPGDAAVLTARARRPEECGSLPFPTNEGRVVSIDTDEVLRIAALAHLELDEPTVETFRHQLRHILDYIGMLSDLDAASVSPTTHPLGRGQASRPDTVVPSLTTEAALRNAPDASAGQFRVPRVLKG